MNINEVARISRLPAKTIRFYEAIGLVRLRRAGNGYRRFGERDLYKLAFIGRARRLGFSVQDCRELLALYEDRNRPNADVRRIAEATLERIDAKLVELDAMRRALTQLIASCHGDQRPDCPILDDLEGRMPRARVFPK
jgi:Cu(I)-responsive transcriptional regulator